MTIKMTDEAKVKEFISKWQHLEALVKQRARGSDATKFRDDLLTISQQDSLFAHQQLMAEDLYALRNVYLHKNRSRYIASIQDHVLKDVDNIIHLLEYPPSVKDIFGCEVYSCGPTSAVLEVMDNMSKNVFTHVPLVKDGKVVGVFSYNSFFEWAHDVLARRNDSNFEKSTMQTINPKYLNQPVVRYEFISENESAGKVLSIFRDRTTDLIRLDCIFITDDGKRTGNFKGIITPWDLYKVW